jgi:hypothetical protein
MALASSRFTEAVARRARSRMGKRFGRFAVTAACALGSNEIVLFLCLHAGMNAGTGAALGWLAGSIVSYVMSKWAFSTRSKPNFLRQTLPFWTVSAMVLLVLYLATKLGAHAAGWLGLTGTERKLFIVGVNFLANCVTFLARFVFFHFVLFAEKGAAAAAVPDAAGTPEEPFVRVEADLPPSDEFRGFPPDGGTP